MNGRMLIWHDSQRTPAKCYGDQRWGSGRYTVTVHETQAEMDAARKADPEAICYHFSGSSGGGGITR